MVLESSEEQDSSYLSLQPPLDRPLNDTIQFESIDLYFWTGPQFRTPTILFYLGPLCLMNSCDLSVSKYCEVYNFSDAVVYINFVLIRTFSLYCWRTVEPLAFSGELEVKKAMFLRLDSSWGLVSYI